jgi:hypothetical protein
MRLARRRGFVDGLGMPFRHLSQISLDERRGLTEAFDKVCARLALSAEDPRRSVLAAKIVELASQGERNPDALVEAILKTHLV